MNPAFWKGKRVFVTGHTGFKGSWLTLWLSKLGAKVAGYSLAPSNEPNLFEVAHVIDVLDDHTIADIRDLDAVHGAIRRFAPEIVFHAAAQALVRESYVRPVETYATNVMGTVHVLEAVRSQDSTRAVVVVTSDKCYDNREVIWAYRETDPMGGSDPYSSSKGCAELATTAYARSFFLTRRNPCSIASVRAGNVIGGGDWANDRLIPDVIRGLLSGQPIIIRRPRSIRPWQHVLEPLSGYIEVAEQLWAKARHPWEGWNFGPDANSERTSLETAELACRLWGRTDVLRIQEDPDAPHEALLLKLDSTKARTHLGWQSRWSFEPAVARTVEWYRRCAEQNDMQAFSYLQIEAYEKAGVAA